MAKQRNSLGICVLTWSSGDSKMSFEAYKEKYGVNLDDIFTIGIVDRSDPDNPIYGVGIKSGYSKIIALKMSDTAIESMNIPPITFPTHRAYENTADKSTSYLELAFTNDNYDFGFEIQIYADRRITGGEI